MALKITNEERKGITLAVDAVTAKRELLEAAIIEANEKIADIALEIERSVKGYNDAVGILYQEVDGVYDRLETEYSERSEKWQESDRGREVCLWIDNIGDGVRSYLDEIHISLTDEIDTSDIDWADTIVNENLKWNPED